MREVKSVKVDNWGVFFLQKLQNFFNKTDYCDLTLQFNDNSQLKVHRLVLSACTDYFNVLEQTCEVIDDILVMPPGLQADVIVPIVNFMYTGTLEFEINMYGRLLKTARDMNMTVLLKLLEAHKRTVDSTRTQNVKRVPKSFPPRRPVGAAQIRVERNYITQSINAGEPHRTVPVSAHQLRTLQIKPIAPSTSYYTTTSGSEPTSIAAKYANNKAQMKGPSRFECNDETTLPPDSFEQFDSISYESKPLLTAQTCKDEIDDYDNLIPAHDTSSTFEQLRKGYTGHKRPASSVSSFESPPEKKPNIEDVKEYAEQQRMRKQITAEYDDDQEYDEMLDDEFHNDDDDEDYVPPAHVSKMIKKQPSAVVIKQEKDQKPTIVVKDTVGSNVNHAKIISEVLKKYPHLVKNNKNIKLKIMAKSSTSPNQSQSIIIKQEPEVERAAPIQTQTVQRPVAANTIKRVIQQPLPAKQTAVAQRPAPAQVSISPQRQQPQQKPIHNVPTTTVVTQKVPVTTNPAPRRIDSKTMHALIALGAENTTGPWLCLRCGVNGRPISIPSYRGFRRHLINTHNEKVDPRLCEYCGWRSGNNTELHHHMRVQHDVIPPAGYDFPPCSFCPSIFLNKQGLERHLKEVHPEKLMYQQQCMYCDEAYKEEDDLYNHLNTQHKTQAQKDGFIDYTDDEDTAYYTSETGDQTADKGIKILSNIAISPQAGIKPPASKLGAEGLSSVASGIAASLGLIDSSDSQEEIQYLDESGFIAASSGSAQEPKFVNADGQIMELTPEQRDEIISQLGAQPEGGVVMVLNESFAPGAVASGEAEAEGEAAAAKMEAEENNLLTSMAAEEKEKSGEQSNDKADWHSDSQSSLDQAVKDKEPELATDKPTEEAQPSQEDTELNDESVEDDDKEDSAKPEDEDKKEDPTEKLEKAKEKLKMLAGDWSDEDDEDEDETPNTTNETVPSADTSKEIDDEQKTNAKEQDREIIFETTTATKEEVEATEITAEEPATAAEEETTNDDVAASNADEGDNLTPEVEASKAEEETPAEAAEDSLISKDDDPSKQSEPDPKDTPDTDTESKVSKRTTRSTTENAKKLDEKNPAEDEKKAKSGTGTKKNVEGGDRIRTLISDWGDDEEEDL